MTPNQELNESGEKATGAGIILSKRKGGIRHVTTLLGQLWKGPAGMHLELHTPPSARDLLRPHTYVLRGAYNSAPQSESSFGVGDFSKSIKDKQKTQEQIQIDPLIVL